MKTDQAISALSALAHEGRLAAFRLLIKAGPEGMAAGDLATRLKMPPSSLSTNLMLLSHAGLVSSRRDGRSIIYRVDYGAMRDLLGFLIEDCCNGSSEICTPLAATLVPCAAAERR